MPSRVPLIVAICLLAACAPDLPGIDDNFSDGAREQPYPRLQPIGGILEEGDRSSVGVAGSDRLVERGTALSRRTIAVPEAGTLTARGARLRDRAAALRAAEV